MTQLLNTRRLRETREVKVDIGNGDHVLARKEDMTLLVFEGRVPMPVLAAVQEMIELPNATPIERIAALGDSGKSLIQILRAHAVKVVVQPVLTLIDDGNPDHLPADMLDVNQLMAIWTATAVVPPIGAPAAAEFRPRAVELPAAPVPDGEAVPPTAKPVAIGDVAEFVGR
jgi:hypothetical protein